MKKTLLVAALGIIGTLSVLDPAAAQMTASAGIETIKVDPAPPGWSVKRSILGKMVRNEAGEDVGRINDLIIDPGKNVSYLIVGVGGFIGLGRRDVAIDTASIRRRGEQIVLAGASRDEVRALPRFDYAVDDGRHARLVASAEQEVDRATQKILELQSRTGPASGVIKDRLVQDIAGLEQDQQAVKDGLAAMKAAGAPRWQAFEARVNKAAAHLRRSVEQASS
jgi:sporulation protein YlmC with PRC-barrel domain